MSLAQSQSLPASRPTSRQASRSNSPPAPASGRNGDGDGDGDGSGSEEPDYEDTLDCLSLVEEEHSLGGQGSSRRRKDKLLAQAGAGAGAGAGAASVYPMAGVEQPADIAKESGRLAAAVSSPPPLPPPDSDDEAEEIGVPVLDVAAPEGGEAGDYDNMDEIAPGDDVSQAPPPVPPRQGAGDPDTVSLGDDGFGFGDEAPNAQADSASYLQPRPKRATEVFDGLTLSQITVECVCRALQSLGMAQHCAAFRRDQVGLVGVEEANVVSIALSLCPAPLFSPAPDLAVNTVWRRWTAGR